MSAGVTSRTAGWTGPMADRLPCPAPACPGVEDPAARERRSAESVRSNGARGYRRGCWLCMGEGRIVGWMLAKYRAEGVAAVARELHRLGWVGDDDLGRILVELGDAGVV